MKYKGKIVDNYDLVTKKYVDDSVGNATTTINNTISQVQLTLQDNIASLSAQLGDQVTYSLSGTTLSITTKEST